MPAPLPQITHTLAERHESLWLRLSTLHKDICAIAAKKPEALVGHTERATAEGLISDSRPFLSTRREKLPVAAESFSGLAVQLGQVLAQLEDYENRHAYWDGKQACRCWRVAGEPLPIGRLRQNVAVVKLTTRTGDDLRAKLVQRMDNRNRQIFEDGFQKGLSARHGPPQTPDAEGISAHEGQNNPRTRRID